MLKYVDVKLVFQEIPNEITIAVNISGCPCACEGCHSSYLAGDIGEELTTQVVDRLLARHEGATCVSFMGGDAEPSYVSLLAFHVRQSAPNIKTAWYSGRDTLSSEITLSNFDFVKIGSYQPSRGGLNEINTNQRLYAVEGASLCDITHLMQK